MKPQSRTETNERSKRSKTEMLDSKEVKKQNVHKWKLYQQ
jgi:hypothetical protein